MTHSDLGALIRRYRLQAGYRQETVAHELSQLLGKRIHQTQVSDNENGTRWNDPDLAGAYVKVLGIPGDEMAAAMGYSIQPGPRPTTLADIVKADPTLSKTAKRHLLNQYELLQLASRQERQGNPVLTETPAPKKPRRTG